MATGTMSTHQSCYGSEITTDKLLKEREK